MSKLLPSYPSIYNLGHRALEQLFDDPVIVEEKIDGSQISFGIVDGELIIRSKSAHIDIDAPPNMFGLAVEYIKSIEHKLNKHCIYRGEYVSKPKHNTLKYSRIPTNYIIIFDIDAGDQYFLEPKCKEAEAKYIGLECVPMLLCGGIKSVDEFKHLLDMISCLGETKIEGVVIKNYHKFGPDHKVLMGKFVSEAFKETNKVNWKQTNPQTKDVIQNLITMFKTENRWLKAIQHLRDLNQLEDSPKDIGKLVIEIPEDIKKEHEDEIKEVLFKFAWPQIKRGIIHGMPEFYKELLLQKQFKEK